MRWIDDLAARGLLERSQDPADRRRNVISITAQGRQWLEELDVRLGRAQDELLAALSKKERNQLVALLRRALGLQR